MTTIHSSFEIYGKKISILLIALLLAIIIRGLTLEYGDLLDPTETRYATIAQNMLFSGDWVTPRLPNNDGLELYFSKPPLHYWLTAISYQLFGIDEWTSRLPSFLALLLMLGSILLFAKKFFTLEIGYLAGLICVTSPLMFFLSGSSTIDVTFGALTFAALVVFAVAASEAGKPGNNQLMGHLFFIFSALALMTKGPIGLILIGIPVFFYCCYHKSLKCLAFLPWVGGISLFLLITVPWFYLVEKANPGSVRYFFVNENFLRFVAKDYGGKYGDAHIQPYGAIWWMLILSILPWSLYLVKYFIHNVTNFNKSNLLKENKWLLFILIVGISPILFFTVARSILPAYVVPAVPGLALFIGYITQNSKRALAEIDQNNCSLLKKSFFHKFKGDYPCILKTSVVTYAIINLLFLIAAPIIEVNKSASEILELITSQSKSKTVTVAIVATNNYSPYWTSGAYQEELSKPLKVIYVKPTELDTVKYKNLILRGDDPNLLAQINLHYKRFDSRGKWHWYRRII